MKLLNMNIFDRGLFSFFFSQTSSKELALSILSKREMGANITDNGADIVII